MVTENKTHIDFLTEAEEEKEWSCFIHFPTKETDSVGVILIHLIYYEP